VIQKIREIREIREKWESVNMEDVKAHVKTV
jgi:hypothetical protein